MSKINSYIVCHDHIKKVKAFLSKFFTEKKSIYSHEEWITFKLPGTSLELNLMAGPDQRLTQNYTLEFEFSSMKELKDFAKKHKRKINSFKANKAKKKYLFHFVSIGGPQGICKVEASFAELV